jgi:hypothetical protein
MKTALHRTFAAFLLMITAFGLASQAQAELAPSLLEKLLSPLMYRAMSSSIEGRALAERLLGEGFAWQASQSEWKRISEQMVERVFRDQGAGVADEVYLRVLRLEQRFRAEAPKDSALLTGEGKASFDDLTLMQRIASEELALREATLLERMRGIDPAFGGQIEFAKVPRQATGNLSSDRQRFLSEAASGSALDRANKVLSQLGNREELTILLFQTPEGKEILRRALGTRVSEMYEGKVARDVIAMLSETPELRDLTIQLALRLDQAMSAYDGIRMHAGFGNSGPLRKSALRRVAGEYLKLSPPAVPGAINFAPATPNAKGIDHMSALGIKPRARQSTTTTPTR